MSSGTLYLGTCFDADTGTGAWCLVEGTKSKTVVDREVTTQASSEDSLFLIAFSEFLRQPPYRATLFTSSECLKAGLSGERDSSHSSFWEIIDERSDQWSEHLSVKYIKHVDNKPGTRHARVKAEELLLNHIQDSAVCDGSINSSSRVAGPSGGVSVKNEKEIVNEPLSLEEGRLCVLDDSLLSGAKEGHDQQKAQEERRVGLLSLDIVPEQSKVIAAALELYARLGMGQLSDIGTLFEKKFIPAGDEIKKGEPKKREVSAALNHLESVLGHPNRAGRSIFDEKVCNDARIAWDLYKSITDTEVDDLEFSGNIEHRPSMKSLRED